MNRIRIVSLIAKFVMLALLVFTLYRPFFFSSWSGSRGGSPVLEKSQAHTFFWYHTLSKFWFIILLFWYWKLFRLFNLYQRGLIFSAQTIRCIKILGILCAVGWILGTALRVLPHPLPPSQIILPPGVAVSEYIYRIGFFSFDFGTGINFGLLFAGIVIVLIAWIMDEGRKIQEEQELTV